MDPVNQIFYLTLADVISQSNGKYVTHGSPITNESPVLIEGISPRDPTRAAAASLRIRKERICIRSR